MNVKTYSHLCKQGEWSSQKIATVVDIIKTVNIKIQRGCSSHLRKIILEELNQKGWSSLVKLSYRYQISITTINGNLGLCLQTGNMGRFYADLLKLQYLYKKGNINSAIYVLPTKRIATIMGSNVANFERFVKELTLFSDIVTIPIFVIGLD